MTKLEIKGEASKETVDRLLNSLGDLFSPITESLGLVGDHIRYHREMAIIKSFRKAKSIVEETGIKLTPPPSKFLLTYIESVSSENPDDDEILEIWANLLVSASVDFDSTHLVFCRILAELTSGEAKLLKYVAIEDELQRARPRKELQEVEYKLEEDLDMIIRHQMNSQSTDLLKEVDFKVSGLVEGSDDDAALTEVINDHLYKIWRPGVGITEYWILPNERATDHFAYSDAWTGLLQGRFFGLEYELLKYHGLMKQATYAHDHINSDFKFEYNVIWLTRMGVEFYFNCSRPKLKPR